MDQTPISNRYHRSGAIDMPVEYAVRQVQLQNAERSKHGKRMWADCGGNDTDVYSITEGEPMFTVKRAKGKGMSSSLETGKNPLPVLSSLNGYSCSTTDKLQDALAAAAGTPREDTRAQLDAYDKLRDTFFNELSYAGVAVTKFSYAQIGRQGNQLVGTRGGLNTIFTDTDVHAGQVLIVDMPHAAGRDENKPPLGCNGAHTCAHPWGLVHWQTKKGVPKGKRTLVVRALPHIPSTFESDGGKDISQFRKFIRGFFRRGQVIGKCVRGARAGGRVDVILEGNSVGTWSCSDIAW
jgi:hypothetical protein